MTRDQSDPRSLYEHDFYSWTQQQAALLRAGNLHDADLSNIIEEIETLGRSELHALRSRYAVLCTHLLKSIVQPERCGRSWDATIIEQRVQIARLLEDNPGLKPKKGVLFRQAYEDARKIAAVEMGVASSTLSKEPLFTIVQAEDEAWRPQNG